MQDGEVVMIFNSVKDIEENSELIFGVKLCHSKISMVANGKRPHHKGFIFRYVD